MSSQSILFVVTHSEPGGVLEIWSDLVAGLNASGHSASLVALYPGPSISAKAVSIRHIVPERPASPAGNVQLVRGLIDFLRAAKPDVILTAMPAANVLVPVAARLARSAAHMAISHHTPVSTYSRILGFADTWVGSSSLVDTIVCVSGAVSDSLNGKPERYRSKRRTIRNALPPRIERHLCTLAAAANASPARRVVATGRLAAQKNYPVLLRAMAELNDVELHIAGGGPDERGLKNLARALGVSRRVTFHGNCTREEALALLASSDIFAQPSLFEGHSLALVEAAKLSKPLIVSDVPSQIEGATAPDGELCAIVVPIDDGHRIAQEIGRLLDEPEYFAHWQECSRRLGQSISYERMLKAYLETFVGGDGEHTEREIGAT